MKFSLFTRLRLKLIVFIVFAGTLGCSTQKNTPVSRAFHNLTSKYNYFFNAKESYKEAIKRVETNFDYNYTFPLPVLLVGEKQVGSMVGGDMDRAITKCTEMIGHHSITIKPERKRGVQTTKERQFYNQNEFVRWVREGWLLVGKARVWKGSYDEARMTFEHILVQFPETPMWYEAQVWLARLDIIANDYVSAEDRLRNVSSNRKYPKSKYYKNILESTWASFYHKQENISQTIKYLERALPNASSRSEKIRYTYLLAQLHQKQANIAQSNKFFAKVIKLSNSYEISFNARVNIASNYKGGSGSQEMIRTLNKMARDEKNVEYLDQIYYALGNIEQSKGNTEKAIEYFQISAKKSVNNNHQKGLSYLILADYFFAKPNYTKSQAYYDSSYNALDSNFPGYKELEVKTKNLNRLVEGLNIISEEDSLQRFAALTPRERDAIIAEKINAVKEEENRLKKEEQEGRDRFSQFQQNQRNRPEQNQGGAWYFYNQASLSFGLSEFQMRWGRRKLEDNWRRVNKRDVIDQTQPIAQTATETEGVPAKVLDNKSREYYLQNVPINDSLMALSHKRIQDALLRVGEVYENNLKDYPEAIKAYELLATRYPQTSNALSAYYNLYQIARFNQMNSEMERFKQVIISQYPTSTYALMLSNPNYLAQLQQENKEMEDYYQNTYTIFVQGDCNKASKLAKDGMERYKNVEMVSKFHFIIAQCIGSTGDIREYKNTLTELVKLYPKTEVATTATGIISFLDRRELQLATAQTEQIVQKPEDAKPLASYKTPQGEHLFIAIVPKKSPINQLKFNLVSFNVDNFINLNLNVASRELSSFVELITVDKFKSKVEAMEYYRKASADLGLMGNLTASDFSYVVISRENFEIFVSDKSVAGYLNFFRETYLK